MSDDTEETIGYATRKMPRALLRAVDEYAAKVAPPRSRPQRDAALFALLERGLAEAIRERGGAHRGDVGRGTRREA